MIGLKLARVIPDECARDRYLIMIRNAFKKFVREESGQTTTEYILILAVVVTMIMQFKTKFSGIINNIFGKLDSQIEEDIFDGG